MAEFTSRVRVLKVYEWILPNGANFTEICKAATSARIDYQGIHDRESLPDDWLKITGDGEQIIMSFDVEG